MLEYSTSDCPINKTRRFWPVELPNPNQNTARESEIIIAVSIHELRGVYLVLTHPCYHRQDYGTAKGSVICIMKQQAKLNSRGGGGYLCFKPVPETAGQTTETQIERHLCPPPPNK